MEISDRIRRMTRYEILRIRRLVSRQQFGFGEVVHNRIFPFSWMAPIVLYGESYEAYTRLLNEIFNEINVMSRSEIEQKIRSLLLHNLESSAIDVQRAVDELFTELEDIEETEWILYVPLRARITEDLEIGQITIHPPNDDVWNFMRDNPDLYDNLTYEQVRRLPFIEARVGASTPGHAEILGRDRVDNYVNFIRLCTHEITEITPYFFVTQDNQGFDMHISTPGYPKLDLASPRRRTNFERALAELDSLIPILENQDGLSGIENRVKKALKWFGRGQNEGDESIKFICYVIVSEILTIGSRERESNFKKDSISYHFKKVIGTVVKHPDSNYREIEQLATGLYDKRSKIVHTGWKEITFEDIQNIENFATILIWFFGNNTERFTNLNDFHGLIAIRDFLTLICKIIND